VWRLQAGFVTPSQEARSPSVPDEGAAFNGWTRSDEGRRQCRLDHVWVCPSGPLEEARWLSSKIAAVERRKARLPRAKGRRVAFAKVPQVLTCARPALRLPQGRQKKTRARARRQRQDDFAICAIRRVEAKTRAWRNERMQSCLLPTQFDLSRCEDKVPAA
jgi:hypothetical protein